MMKNSVELMRNLVNGVEKRMGNHELCIINGNGWFKYHGNTIFVINFTDMAIIVDNCDYNTVSTTRAINSHLEAFLDTFPQTSLEFDFIDLTKNKKFNKKITELFKKSALSEEEYVKKNSWR